MVSEVSDEEIRAVAMAWIENADFMNVTRKDVIEKLEELHGWDLSEKKDLIKDVFNEFVDRRMTEYAAQADEEVQEEEDDASVASGGDAPKGKAPKKSGFQKELVLSHELAEFMGSETSSRPNVVKQLWAYIKENNLQNPENKREILADSALELIFKRQKFTMFQMNKILTPHMKAADDIAPASPQKPVKRKAPVKKESNTSKKAKTSKSKASEPKTGGGGGFAAPVRLSPALAEFLGEEVLPRTQVTKRLWDYIKANELQNPANKREIVCDKAMKKAFQADKFTMFEMSKLVSPMLSKITDT